MLAAKTKPWVEQAKLSTLRNIVNRPVLHLSYTACRKCYNWGVSKA
jgi:hypothetical protein